MSDGVSLDCPHCGELLWVAVDAGGGRRQHLITDCEVCCRPIELELTRVTNGEWSARATREGEDE